MSNTYLEVKMNGITLFAAEIIEIRGKSLSLRNNFILPSRFVSP